MPGSTLRTEVRGLDLYLDEDLLSLSQSGEDLLAPVRLSREDADKVAIAIAKAQLWEWNQLEDLKSRAEMRYRRYLGSWLVMCLAAFSAYLGYPSYYLCIFLSLLSIFLWWRAAYVERQADAEAQAQRRAFVADWSYIRERLDETVTESTEEGTSATT
jgi:hypothetical protein